MEPAELLRVTQSFDADDAVFRIALSPDRAGRVDRLRTELGDGPELKEALAFLDEPSFLDLASLPALLGAAFSRTPFPNDRRFSDGSFGVLYTALEQETAADEYGYWAPRHFGAVSGKPYRVRSHLISCRFRGLAKDVRKYLHDCAWLVSDQYLECQRLGVLVKKEGTAGLYAPSARRPSGTTIPIFAEASASAPRVESEVIFTVEGGRQATYRFTDDAKQ